MTYLTRMKAVDLAELVTELGIYHPVSIKIDLELQRRMATGSLRPLRPNLAPMPDVIDNSLRPQQDRQ